MGKKKVIKADGRKQVYNESKILNSLKQAGASEDVARDTADKISDIPEDNIETDLIYRDALANLQKLEPKSALKYSLKRAIMDMGPDGYTFEKYVARIFNAHGYETEHGKTVTGRCVRHELDVIAKKGNQVNIIECKYHNDLGIKSDIKTALYVHSRYLDVKNEFCADGSYDMQAWLATNTKVTSDVKQYSDCIGMKILAWKYPKSENLEYFIETKYLYPVSILSKLSGRDKDKLYDNDVITIKDLDFIGEENLKTLIGASKQKVSQVFDEVNLLLYG